MSALANFGQWVYLMQQIHEAQCYVKRAEEFGHPHLFTSYEAFLDFLSYFRSALNSYAKCFVSAGSGRRRLEGSVVFYSRPDLLSDHERIIDLRHKYVAHNDENEFETSNVRIKETTEELTLNLEYGISFPFDRLYELRSLIGFVEIYVVDAQKRHIAAISRKTGKKVRVLEGGSENV